MFSGSGKCINKTLSQNGTPDPTHDFYKFNNHIFRASDIECATRIALNRYLIDFNNYCRICDVVECGTGTFTVEIFSVPQNDTSLIFSGKETHEVSYYGTADMFTSRYEQDNCNDAEFNRMLDAMKKALADGHPSVRTSKNNGRVIFSDLALSKFPRWRPDVPADADVSEQYFSHDRYLSTDIESARLQMKYAVVEY